MASARERTSLEGAGAAMRSQRLSAAAPSRASQVDAAERGIPLRGEDPGQGHGAVEEVGAARLAGPFRRPGHVEHVVEKLEGETDAGAEYAQ